MTTVPEGFIPYKYRQKDPVVIPVLSSIVEIGTDPNSPAEARETAIRLLSDNTFAARHGVYGHTVQAARMMLEEMDADIRDFNNPLHLLDGVVFIDS